MGVYDKRKAFKPYEYPEVLEFREAIKHSRWDVEEFNLEADAFEFKHKLSQSEQELIKRALLAISQIEIAVKTFWAKLGEHLPKPEFNSVGITFAENEIVHAEAYSKLLEVLGFNNEFDQLLTNPVIGGRVDYLTKYLKNEADSVKEAYTLNLTLFSLFIENVSLFSQFAIIKSFLQNKNYLKEVDTIVEATMKEETIHGKFGVYLINLIKKEYPKWFNEDFYEKIEKACKKAFNAEMKIIDWMFEAGEVDSVSKEAIIEFIKHRFNSSLKDIGAREIFEIDDKKLSSLYWMVEAIYAYTRNDFFCTQSTNYTKFNKPVTINDLFDD